MEIDPNCGTPIEKSWPKDTLKIVSECLLIGFLSPFERLTNLKMLSSGRIKVRELLQTIKHHEGRASLWRGASTNVMFYLSYLIFEKAKYSADSKYHVEHILDPNDLNPARKVIYSSIFQFALFGIPLRVIKANLAPIHMDKLVHGKVEPPRNVLDCLNKIVKSEGISGLYRGSGILAVYSFFGVELGL